MPLDANTGFEQAVIDLAPDVYWRLNSDGVVVANDPMVDAMENLNGNYRGAGLLGLAAAESGFAGVGQYRQFRRSTFSYAEAASDAALDWPTTTSKGTLLLWLIWRGGTVNNVYSIATRSAEATYIEPYHSYAIKVATPSGSAFVPHYAIDSGGTHLDRTATGISVVQDVPTMLALVDDQSLGSNQFKLYQDDGSAVAQQTVAGDVDAAAGKFQINNLHDAIDAGAGDFDIAHVAIWNSVALSAAEISALWDERDNETVGGGGDGIEGDQNAAGSYYYDGITN